jgi:hypothetical protein
LIRPSDSLRNMSKSVSRTLLLSKFWWHCSTLQPPKAEDLAQTELSIGWVNHNFELQLKYEDGILRRKHWVRKATLPPRSMIYPENPQIPQLPSAACITSEVQTFTWAYDIDLATPSHPPSCAPSSAGNANKAV